MSFQRLGVCLLVLLIAILGLSWQAFAAEIIWVATDGNDTTGNGSESNPYATIQKGIDEASAGDTVIVKNGIYTGTGNKDLNFDGKATTVKSENGPENCIIDCQDDGRGFYFHNDETSDSIVEGFTIKNGDTGIYYGAGIYCYDGASPTITNCIFTDNSTRRGGAIACKKNCSPTISGCTMKNNWALDGGGLWCYDDSDPIVSDCVITSNTADNNGGGVFCYDSSPTIRNCLIADNEAISPGVGGGVYFYYGSAGTLTNCTIANNSGVYGGGLAAKDSGTSLTANNSIVWGNTATYGNQMRAYGYGAIYLNYCDYANGDNDVNTSSQGTVTPSNCINSDPDFVDDANGDYHLDSDSPCIDTGSNLLVPEGVDKDLDGYARIVDGDCEYPATVDIGAYEYAQAPPVADFTAEPTSGAAPLAVQFSDLSTGNITSRQWDFDNNGTVDSQEQHPSYTYTCPGVYTVQLRVTGANGSDTEKKINYIVIDNAIYVDAIYGDNQNDGSSIANAVKTLKKGLELAQSGSWVLVADGLYVGEDNSNLDFQGKAVYLKSIHGPMCCKINCDGRAFRFHSGEDQDSVLDGFTIQYGSESNGGAIRCENDSNPRILNCILKRNSADYGGAIWCSDSSPSIVNCLIVGNKANYHGGAVFCEDDSNPTFTNCTIDSNTSETSGGGIFSTSDSDPTLDNSILWDNTAGDGHQIYTEDTNSSITLRHSDYADNSLDTKNIEGAGNVDDTDDCIALDPKYTSTSPRDYHLWKSSPCMNTGDESLVPSGIIVDLDENFRKIGMDVDMGAYEGGRLLVPTDYLTVQAAINVADDGEVVLLEDGTYNGSIVLSGRAIYIESLNGPANCIIKGGSRGITIENGSPGLKYLTFDNEGNPGGGILITDSVPTLEGCIIINNIAENGGGIECYNSIVVITDCIIKNNKATRESGACYGGGMYLDASNVTITGCTIDGNSVESADSWGVGGGIFCSHCDSIDISRCSVGQNKANPDFEYGEGGGIYSIYSHITIAESRIYQNEVSGSGGGIYCIGVYDEDPVTILNCRIQGNLAGGGESYFGNAGGIMCMYSNPVIANCEIVGNSVVSTWLLCGGGGLYVDGFSNPTITNCTIADNSVENNKGGGLYLKRMSNVILNNTIIWGNSAESGGGNQIYVHRDLDTATLNYCDVPNDTQDPDRYAGDDVDSSIDENNCIHADPGFYGATYYLSQETPYSDCKDAGSNSLAEAAGLDWDIRGVQRKYNAVVDIGSFETVPPARWALVVGIDIYAKPDAVLPWLNSPADEAYRILYKLQNSNYWTTDFTPSNIKWLLPIGTTHKPTKHQIKLELEKLIWRAGPKDTILYYHVGHGDTNSDHTESCLIPYDGSPWENREDPCPPENIVREELKDWLSGAITDKVLVVIDACYSEGLGPLFSSSMDGEFIASAAIDKSAKEELIEGEWRAVFTQRFLLALDSSSTDVDPNNGMISALEVYDSLRGLDQSPKHFEWWYGMTSIEFIEAP